MALSATESALLTETCINMNVAANTVREVLEMLRSLGNSGVVDIATHNNAIAPHANATNLVHIDSGHAHLGTLGELYTAWASNYPFIIQRFNAFSSYFMNFKAISNGNTSLTGVAITSKFALTDSEKNLLSNADAVTAGYSPTGQRIFYIDATGLTSNGEAGAGIYWMLGDKNDGADFSRATLRFYFTDGANYHPKYEMNNKNFAPGSAAYTLTIGESVRKFDTAYFSSAINTGSDRRLKTDVSSLDEKAVRFVNELRPVSYKLAVAKTEILEVDENGDPVSVNEQPGTRTHWGFVAQEVKDAMTAAGIPDAAAWTLADKNDPDSTQSLRYEELIAPLVKAVQVLAAKVESLEAR